MEQIERERRFLIELPLKWVAKFKIATAERVRIYQTYLNVPDEECARVRCLIEQGGSLRCEYKYTTKKFISHGVNKETEIDLTQTEYVAKLKLCDTKKHRIAKMRYFLIFDNREFVLDIFEDNLTGLAILEIELQSMAEEVLLPPYLKNLKEVTDDKLYSNLYLADINNYSKSTLEKIKFARRSD